MARETLKLTGGEDWGAKPVERTVEVEYVRTEHWNSRSDCTAYKVIVDGKYTGRVEQTKQTTSTTYAGTRMRRDLGNPTQWGWHNSKTRKSHPAGLYQPTRRMAVARMLGFRMVEKVG